MEPGERSAIYAIQSQSSKEYTGALALHFFYMNVGSKKPWLARVEIPAWVAVNQTRSICCTQRWCEQCRLLGTRPYPYLLHRAHEEAVVHFDEKEQVDADEHLELRRRGLGLSA